MDEDMGYEYHRITTTKHTHVTSTESQCLKPKPIEKLINEKYNKMDNYNEIGFTRTS